MRSYHDESRAATAEISASHVIYSNVPTLSTHYQLYLQYIYYTHPAHVLQEAVSGQSDLDGKASEKLRSKQCI